VRMFFGNGKVRPNAGIQLLQDLEENPKGSYEFIVAAQKQLQLMVVSGRAACDGLN